MLNVDLRLWHPMSFRTLTEAPWNLAAGLFRCANGPRHAALLGLHDGHIWQGIQQLTAAASFSAQNAMMIHLVFAQALCSQGISDHYVHHLRLQYANSSGMIICIFEVDWHWTLLTGCQCSNKLHWQHNDGFISAAFPGARQLAATCSHLVGLDFTMPTQHRHISQLDPHTHTHTHTHARHDCTWTSLSGAEPWIYGSGSFHCTAPRLDLGASPLFGFGSISVSIATSTPWA